MTDYEKLNTVPNQLQSQTIQIFENLGLDLGANYDGGNGHSNTSGRRAYFDNGEGYRISVHEDTEWFVPNNFQVWIEDDDGDTLLLTRYNLTAGRVITESASPTTLGLSDKELKETFLTYISDTVINRQNAPMDETDRQVLSVLLYELETLTSPNRFTIENSHYDHSFKRIEIVEHEREVRIGGTVLHALKPAHDTVEGEVVDEK